MTAFLENLFSNQPYNKDSFFLIAGPCVVESEDLVFEVAEKVSALCNKYGIPYILKASYRKANRTSANSFTGLGDENGLEILQ
ncbi:MAG TPA: 3-deoxy-8-phosphooctulonate synthase, partial [Flavisolibacter sp.]|nr:3-deoxy-8-phosphooctulonate synthase [Flavisolibacter sp.]